MEAKYNKELQWLVAILKKLLVDKRVDKLRFHILLSTVNKQARKYKQLKSVKIVLKAPTVTYVIGRPKIQKISIQGESALPLGAWAVVNQL